MTGRSRPAPSTRVGSKPPLDTSQYLLRQGTVRFDRSLCASQLDERNTRRCCFQNFRIRPDTGLKDQVAPVFSQIGGHGLFLPQPPVELAQDDSQDPEIRVDIKDLVDALL